MKNKSAPPLIIKKYENRRLYNTLTSQYINQDQVAQLVRDGRDLRVIDAATGEDLTRLILAQIVLEDAKTPDSVFPLDVLRQMIVASGKATQENALLYAKFMMDVYQNAYRAMPSPVNPFEMMASYWTQPPKGAEPPTTSSPGLSAAEAMARPRVKKKTRSEMGNDVGRLQKRIEELEAALSQNQAPRKARSAKVRRKT